MRAPWWTEAHRDPATEITRSKHSDRRGFFVLIGARQYYLVGVERPPSYETLVAFVRFHPEGADSEFIDKLDLQSADDCDFFITSTLAKFEPLGFQLEAATLRSDLELLRREAERWRDFLVEQSLKWWRTIPRA